MPSRPPYTDDPGCKYIVIEDPWPGDLSGKKRNQVFYKSLLTWVRFMLGRKHEAESLYYMNTRDEVIVQLPEDVDCVPILGEHAWRKFLTHGNQKDQHRVSYIFEYDYRNKGEPGKHNWVETDPLVVDDPPPEVRFPVKRDYPRPAKASPAGKKCRDLALPLPPTWQPPPDTSGFSQYQRPASLTANTVANAATAGGDGDGRRGLQTGEPSTAPGKIDPYQEEEDVKPRIQPGGGAARVKTEGVKQEDAPYVPSAALAAAFRNLYGDGAARGDDPADPAALEPEGRIKAEEPLPVPSAAQIAAFNRLYGEQSPGPSESDPTAEEVKLDPDTPQKPSAALIAAFRAVYGPDGAREHSESGSGSRDTERVKRKGEDSEEENSDGSIKRFKTEHT